MRALTSLKQSDTFIQMMKNLKIPPKKCFDAVNM